MKILLVTKNFNMGGAETHVRELANNLIEVGHDVWLISKDGKQKQFLNSKVNHLIWKIDDWRYYNNVRRIRELIKEKRIEIVHGHQRLGISMGARAAEKTNTPMIATIHGQVKYDIRSRAVKEKLTTVICVRHTSYEEINSCEVLCTKSNLILNGVKEYAQELAKEEQTLMYGSRLDQRHVALLILLIEEVLPELKESFPGIKLRIYGDGKERLKLEETILRSELSDAIEYKGFEEKLGKEYQAATLALACARSAMDALVAGTPVLPVNFHHLGNVIESKNYEEFKRDNFEAKGYPSPKPGELKAKIENFFRNKEKFNKEMLSLKEKIKADLVSEVSLKKLLDVYSKALK